MEARLLPASWINAADPAVGTRQSRSTGPPDGGPSDPFVSRRLRPVCSPSVIPGDPVATRRAFLVTLAGGSFAAAPTAPAQQPAKVPRLGFLTPTLADNAHLREAFHQGLRDLGYVEGRNVVIEYRDAEGKLERLLALAA